MRSLQRPAWPAMVLLALLLLIDLYGFGYQVGPIGGGAYVWRVTFALWPSLPSLPIRPHMQAVELAVAGITIPLVGVVTVWRRFHMAALRTWPGDRLLAFLTALLLLWPLGLFGTAPLYHLTLPIPPLLIDFWFAAQLTWAVGIPVLVIGAGGTWVIGRTVRQRNV